MLPDIDSDDPVLNVTDPDVPTDDSPEDIMMFPDEPDASILDTSKVRSEIDPLAPDTLDPPDNSNDPPDTPDSPDRDEPPTTDTDPPDDDDPDSPSPPRNINDPPDPTPPNEEPPDILTEPPDPIFAEDTPLPSPPTIVTEPPDPIEPDPLRNTSDPPSYPSPARIETTPPMPPEIPLRLASAPTILAKAFSATSPPTISMLDPMPEKL